MVVTSARGTRCTPWAVVTITSEPSAATVPDTSCLSALVTTSAALSEENWFTSAQSDLNTLHSLGRGDHHVGTLGGNRARYQLFVGLGHNQRGLVGGKLVHFSPIDGDVPGIRCLQHKLLAVHADDRATQVIAVFQRYLFRLQNRRTANQRYKYQ